jgi:polyisoprenoid-binding protein YceI
MSGDMTMHGVTSEVTWDIVTNLVPDSVSATATTSFPFAKFGLTIPRLLGLISVEDDIRLVVELKLKRSEAP